MFKGPTNCDMIWKGKNNIKFVVYVKTHTQREGQNTLLLGSWNIQWKNYTAYNVSYTLKSCFYGLLMDGRMLHQGSNTSAPLIRTDAAEKQALKFSWSLRRTLKQSKSLKRNLESKGSSKHTHIHKHTLQSTDIVPNKVRCYSGWDKWTCCRLR